ncbi:MAG: hypothetical protein ABEH90_03910 [Halolamina sp.]
MHAFTDLATAAYCPRKLYHRERDPDAPAIPDAVEEIRELAFRYPELLAADDAALRAEPIEATPTQFRSRLSCVRERPAWPGLADPPARDVRLDGRECRGVAHKVLETPLAPSIVSAGEPPPDGVWEPHSVRAVAAAKALAWEREEEVERAFVEYPAHGTVREIALTTRRKAAYRRALRVVETLDGPPPRVKNGEKCAACEYQADCGVRTRSLLSRLR